jgi:tRNA(Ile2) C34 agmatinyltransferase TiaS
MNIYIGMDDTDNLESRGTGHLARTIAQELAAEYQLLGVTRHQLLVDERVPYTSHNSSAVIELEVPQGIDLAQIFTRVRDLMQADFQTGSDPGLCVAAGEIPEEIIYYGRRTQTSLVTQEQARRLAAENHLLLAGLGGTQDGVIGALAAVGLAASGEDGRYLMIGDIREINGIQPIQRLLQAGICAVRALDGSPVTEGQVLADKLRPARRGGQPIQYVTLEGEYWRPVKLN